MEARWKLIGLELLAQGASNILEVIDEGGLRKKGGNGTIGIQNTGRRLPTNARLYWVNSKYGGEDLKNHLTST